MGKKPRKKRAIAFDKADVVPTQKPETPQPVDANGDEVAVGDILACVGLSTIPSRRLVGIHLTDRLDPHKNRIVNMVLQPLQRPRGAPEQPVASRYTVRLSRFCKIFVKFRGDDWSEDWDHELPPTPQRPE